MEAAARTRGRQVAVRQAPGAPPANSDHQMAVAGGVALGASQQAAAAAAAAYALAQEDKKIANKLNAEMCKNFSVGLQNDQGGLFTSPNYPNPYPTGLVCTRLIEAPPGHFIVLEFRDQFNIEEAGTDCDNDKIEIRDGHFGYSKVLARYCGNKFPPEVRSSDGAMWLRFISDASITHTGFKAVYRFERQKNIKPAPPSECRFNVTAMPTLPSFNGTDNNRTGIHSGIIKNSDVPEKLLEYTKQYNVSLECIWNITVTPGWKIYLTFSNYEINKPNDCDSNFIEIYEENLTEENQTVKFCGTRTEPQQSRSNVFNIRHHALPSASGSRFEIIYTAFREKGPSGCDTMEFDCDDGTCIHDSLKCDGIINCKYRYDEASEPGPCPGNEVQPFFETEHMVIILVVFLTLVSGMGASIVISCWGKIQERRRRKLEYHMRKSREASMEGQINKADQLYGSGGGSVSGNTINDSGRPQNSNLKQRLVAAPVIPADDHMQQMLQQEGKYSLDAEGNIYGPNGQRILTTGATFDQELIEPNNQFQHHQQQQLIGRMLADASGSRTGAAATSSNYGQLYSAGGQQRATQSGAHQLINSSNLSLDNNNSKAFDGSRNSKFDDLQGNAQQQRSLLNSLAASAQKHNGQLMELNRQKSSAEGHQIGAANQQLLSNISIVRNQLAQQQQKHQLIGSAIYQHQNASNDSSNTAGQYIRHPQHNTSIPSGLILHQPSSAQTMPISLAKLNLLQQQQQQQQQQHRQLVNANSAYNQQRALTLSSTHQRSQLYNAADSQAQRNLQTIYGLHSGQLAHGGGTGSGNLPMGVNGNLSSSTTCCNVLGGADCSAMDEVPLVGDLLARAGQATIQMPQNSRINELRSATINAKLPSTANIPRSISAYQLSKSQIRQSQQQQQQLQQQLHQQQQHQQQQQQQQHQLPYKSMSDAGHGSRHQLPNHSLSYPHACTGAHQQQQQQQPDNQRLGINESPALPPPPPPPNLTQVRSSTSCATLPPASDTKRAAFKVSRFDPSQVTGDTLPDSDLLMNANLPMGSLQFDDPSTESDATFGMLMNSIGNTSLNLANHQMRMQQQQQASYNPMASQQHYPLVLGQSFKGTPLPAAPMGQQILVTHLNDCNFVQRQRLESASGQKHPASGASGQPIVCDCGALGRANQLRQQMLMRQQLKTAAAATSSQYDLDSDEQCAMQAPMGYNSNNLQNATSLDDSNNNFMMAGQNNHEAQMSDLDAVNGSLYGLQQQQQQQLQHQQLRFNRFRQQSSEMTAEDDDDDDDEDYVDDDDNIVGGTGNNKNNGVINNRLMDGFDDDDDDDEDGNCELAAQDLRQQQRQQSNDQTSGVGRYKRTRSMVRRNEELRDGPLPRAKHLSGSHTSLGCQSCTCGSQLQLNQVGDEDDQSSPSFEGGVGNRSAAGGPTDRPGGTLIGGGAQAVVQKRHTQGTTNKQEGDNVQVYGFNRQACATEANQLSSSNSGDKDRASSSSKSTENCDTNTIVGGEVNAQQQEHQSMKTNQQEQHPLGTST